MLDPAASLAFLAAHTQRVKLGTGIIILPQRNPLVLAKELASVDVLSNGRLIFGLGAGYLKAEFDALGARFDDRGARTDEYIDVLRALWTQEKPSFAGRTVRFSGIDAQPRPVQTPHPPIVVGGMSVSALERALARGNGWYGFARDLAAAKGDLAGIAAARARVQRPAALGTLTIDITPPRPVDEAAARAYADLGVDRLILMLPGRSEADALRFIEQTEPLVRKLA
jgi:probable F420-dependent oxidoreductase